MDNTFGVCLKLSQIFFINCLLKTIVSVSKFLEKLLKKLRVGCGGGTRGWVLRGGGAHELLVAINAILSTVLVLSKLKK